MTRRKHVVIAVYVRVSTSKQDTATQKRALAEWVIKKKYPKAQIIEYTDSAVSGATLDRPAFKRMMQDIRDGKIHKVITFELSRLSREFLNLMDIMRTLHEQKIVVETPHEGVVPFNDTMEQFIVCAKSLVSAQERELLSRRTKEGIKRAMANGIKVGAPKGSKNRLGKLKEYESDYVARFKRLAKKLSHQELVEEFGISKATVTRLKKKFLKQEVQHATT